MKKFSQLRFDPAAPVEARREFRYDGKDYKPGEQFPVTDSNERRARQLYERRFLRRSENREQVVFPQASGKRVVMRSPGWYDVMGPDDAVLNERPLRKKAAEEFAAL